jgi:hypothetical protein
MPTISERQQPITTASGPAIPASEKRRGLIIVSPGANRFTLSNLSVAVLDQGLTIYPGTLPLRLNWEDDGAACQRAWQAISAVANQTITFYEIYD